MLTRKQNLLNLLAGDTPAWTPCCINFKQWYDHHRHFKTLPTDLEMTGDYLEALKALGCDIFSRSLDGGVRHRWEGVEPGIESQPAQLGPRRTVRFQTPYGELRSISEEQTDATASYTVEDLVKDWQRDGRAYRWLLERARFTWDRTAFTATYDRIGEDGLLMVPVGCTPLKRIHADFGLDYGSVFMVEEPEAARTCCDLFWDGLLPVLRELAVDPRVHAACLMDNVDSPFYTPELCRQYWTPYVRQAADLFAAHGKHLFVHACGKLRGLKEVFRQSHVHGLEGIAHPPLGDFTPADAREMPNYFIYNAGFSAHEQVIRSDLQVREFYQRFFSELNGFPRLIFGAACQTAITTPWSRIRYAFDLCRQFGGRPTPAASEPVTPSRGRPVTERG